MNNTLGPKRDEKGRVLKDDAWYYTYDMHTGGVMHLLYKDNELIYTFRLKQ